jgi:chromosome segregation ATPase
MKQKQHDAFLVSTYTSVKDIEALRDARLDQLKGQRAAAEQYVESLRVRLTSLQSRALTYRPYSKEARRMPDDLAENLVRTVNELRVQSSALTAQGEQEAALRSQFQEDIERYRELHAIHSQSGSATPPRAAIVTQ